jgi:hypothetical protein
MIGDAGSSMGALTGQQITLSQVGRAHAMALAAVGGSVQCPGGGTLTGSLNDSNGDGMFNRAGESVSLIANNCNDGAGTTVNGSFSLALSSYTDTSHLSFTLAFANFRASDSGTGNVAAIDGSVTATLAGVGNFSATSPSLSLSATAGGITRSFGVQAYSVAYVDSGSAVTESVAGTFTSSEFQGQSVQVSTLVPLVTLATDNHPSQGVLQVTGANNSAVKLEALNATQVQVYIDANGDGSFETTQVINWADLG